MASPDAYAPALAHREAGRFADAAAWLRRWTAEHPDDATAHAHLAQALAQDGQDSAAQAALEAARRLAPGAPIVRRNEARLLLRRRAVNEAVQAAAAAVAAEPGDAENHLVLAGALAAGGDETRALAHADTALSLDPAYAEAYATRAQIRLRRDGAEQALADAERAVRLKPRMAAMWALVSQLRHRANRLPGAIEALETALALEPDNLVRLINLGEYRRQARRFGQDESALLHAVDLAPDSADAWLTLGLVFQETKKVEEARTAYTRALAFNPDLAPVHVNLAGLLRSEGQYDEAEARYRTALAIEPRSVEATMGLASVLKLQGRLDEAAPFQRLAAAFRPDLPRLLHLHLNLPVIAADREALARSREAFAAGIASLTALDVALEPADAEVSCPAFYLAYQGENDRPIMTAMSRMVRARVPALTRTSPHVAGWTPPHRSRRIKVGFLSEHLTGHTVGKLNQGLIRLLDRSRFDVTVIHTPTTRRDAARAAIDASADRVVTLAASAEAQARALDDAALDVLVFPDIGMSSWSYFLAHLRAAPVQVASWGHPVTTGIDTVDYFLSAEGIEPPGAEAHYAERLVRLGRLPCVYDPPGARAPALSREQLRLPALGTLYGCPQSLFKIHPDFDPVLADIARGDPGGRIVMIEGGAGAWTDALKARWTRTHPILLDQVAFVPRLSSTAFLALMSHLDVVLDPPHFGSGNTLYEGMIDGAPVVTWPGRFARGRVVSGAYRQMGLADAPIAERLEDYAPLALALGRDPERRAAIRAASVLAARTEIYDDRRALREFEAFLEAAVESAGRGERLAAGWRPPALPHGDVRP
jgi:predicted O-linked N-acetylglucosamine transferase (SPINDLY family)